MSTALASRREVDVAKLRDLSATSGGRILVLSVSGVPPQRVELDLKYPTAADPSYPNNIQGSTRVSISLGPRYPFAEPSVQITSPILHPNVYTSGQVCLGRKWMPSEGLDLLVKRLVQIITFDQAVLNEQSPANGSALSWYQNQRRRYPTAFPTTKVSFAVEPARAGISWVNKK